MSFLKPKTEEQIEKLYETVNKYFKTIDRTMINAIVLRFDDIYDIYEKIMFPNINDRDRRYNERVLLTKRILNNKINPEPTTLNTILNFICAVHHFMYTYENDRDNLFKDTNLFDWLLCALRDVDLKQREYFIFNDETIPPTVEKFLNISLEEIAGIIIDFKNNNPQLYR